MKYILSACVGVALICGADAQRSNRGSGQAWSQGRGVGGQERGIASRERGVGSQERIVGSQERGGRGGFPGTDVIEACIVEAGDCQLDFEVTALIDTLTSLEAEKEEGNTIEPPEELRMQITAFKQCITGLVPNLPETNECRVTTEAKWTSGSRSGKGGYGGRGRQGGRKGGDALEKLTACAEEIDFSCFLDYEAVDLVATVMELKAETDATGARPVVPEEIKLQLEAARQCLQMLKPDLSEGTCSAALTRPDEDDEAPTEIVRAAPRSATASNRTTVRRSNGRG
jgi:hypothetical protein